MSRVLPIRTYGDPVLREPARPVAELTPEIQALIDDMFATMRAAQGVGLAAQQVGRTEAICVIELPEAYDREDEKGPRLNPDVPLSLVLINPRIVAESDETCSMEEGCLSFPDVRGNVERAWSVVVEHLDREGRPRKTALSGFFARAAQHEIDHLAGDLFVDRFSYVKKLAVKTKLRQLREETLEKMHGT
ncbi:MAG TPA: peptide deformylase [Kiritimatiellia bacterium]|nr:peptide deformylase [Kiritimatiellia bacterium]